MKTDKKKRSTKLKKPGLIYVVTPPSGKNYCGQTITRFNMRWASHCCNACHKNRKSYSYPISCAIRKYKAENFKYEILYQNIKTQEHLDELEIKTIADYKCHISDGGYNLARGGGSCSGYKLNDKQCATKKKAMNQPEVIAKLRACQLGRIHTEETKEKQRRASLGRKHTEETKEKCRAGRLGKKHTNKTKEKISAITKITHNRPEYKVKISIAVTIANNNPENLLNKATTIARKNNISLPQHVEQRIAHFSKLLNGTKSKKIEYKWSNALKNQQAVKQLAIKQGYKFTFTRLEQTAIDSFKLLTKKEWLSKQRIAHSNPKARLANSMAQKIAQNIPEKLLKQTIAATQRNGISLKQHVEKYIAYYRKLLKASRIQWRTNGYTNALKNQLAVKRLATKLGIYK